jgi:hypothetical protein
MHIEPVEIYSDATNAAILRHPGRRFPGVLIQGDTLHSICSELDRVCTAAQASLTADDYEDLEDLRERLRELLLHYQRTLDQHGLALPFRRAE